MTAETFSTGEFDSAPKREFDVAMDLLGVHLKKAVAAHFRNDDYDHYRDNVLSTDDSTVRIAAILLAVNYRQAVLGTGDILQVKVPIKSVRTEVGLDVQVDPSYGFFRLGYYDNAQPREIHVSADTFGEMFTHNTNPPVANLLDKLLMYEVIPGIDPVM